MASWAGDGADRSIEAAVQLANKEFIKGFIAGQAILGILIFLLVKIFLFRNSDETRAELAWRLERRRLAPKARLAGLQQRRTLDSLILNKIGYDASQHVFETCNWFSILIAQGIATYRHDPAFISTVIETLDASMNNDRKPSFLGPITITEFSLGEEYPILKNARVRLSDTDTNIRVQVDFSFDDQITLGIDTQMLINWPKSGIASLPISLSVSVVKFSGTLVFQFIPEPQSPSSLQSMPTSQTDMPLNTGSDSSSPQPQSQQTPETRTCVSISILDDFILEFEVRSLLGHRTKVKDLPKLTSLICTKLRTVFVDELVWPSRKMWRLPSGNDIFKRKLDVGDETFTKGAGAPSPPGQPTAGAISTAAAPVLTTSAITAPASVAETALVGGMRIATK